MQNDPRIIKAAALFPETFGLRAFPDLTFRVSPTSSYTDDFDQVLLYVQVLRDGKWLDFAKGTVSELKLEVRALPTAGDADAK